MSNDLGMESPNTGDTAPIEAMSNYKGDKAEIDLEKYPDDSAAHDGQATRPSGQGGATPKSRPDYQDMFPKNPEPSETAKAWGEKVDELGQVGAASAAIEESAGTNAGSGPNEGTNTATSETP